MTYIGSVPEVFRLADYERKKQNRANPSREIRTVPMPNIDSNPNIRGPLYVTESYKESYHIEQEGKRKRELKEYELKIIQALAKRDRLRKCLTDLDPKKKRDSKEIAAINFKILNINEELETLQRESGIDLNKLDTGSMLGRFWNQIKEKVGNLLNKAKKFIKKHKEAIEGVLIVVIPIFSAISFRKFFLGL